MDPELSWRRIAFLVTVTTGSVYALLVVSLYMSQRALLFPRPEPVALPEAPRLLRTELTVDAAPVPMWWNVIPEAPLVLFFHGNATQLASTLTQANGALIVGLSFAAVEYPGYGLAPAKEPSEAGCFAAGRAAIAAIADLGLGVPVCMGHSLGSGVAAAMAAEGRCRALVLTAPYTSVGDVGAREYPWVPVRLLVKDPFDTLGRASQIAVPALVIHGRNDEIIPFAMGEALAAAIPGARLLPRETGHNELLDGETWAAVAAFARGLPSGDGSGDQIR